MIPALACVLLARMRSFAVVTAAGLGLGMAQSLITKLQAQFPSLPQHGLQKSIPFALIVVALTLLGRRLPASVDEDQGGAARPGARAAIAHGRWWPPAVAGVALAAAGLVLLPGSYRAGLIQSLITALVCCSLVLLTGYVGQISLAQLAFAGLGGFVFAKLSTGWALPLPLTLAVAGAAAVPLGLLVGVPALRIRGMQLAVVTLGAAVVMQELVFDNTDQLTGGFTGATVPPAAFAGIDLDIHGARAEDYPRAAFGLFVLALLAVVGGGLAHLRRTAAGRTMLAVKPTSGPQRRSASTWPRRSSTRSSAPRPSPGSAAPSSACSRAPCPARRSASSVRWACSPSPSSVAYTAWPAPSSPASCSPTVGCRR